MAKDLVDPYSNIFYNPISTWVRTGPGAEYTL